MAAAAPAALPAPSLRRSVDARTHTHTGTYTLAQAKLFFVCVQVEKKGEAARVRVRRHPTAAGARGGWVGGATGIGGRHVWCMRAGVAVCGGGWGEVKNTNT